MTMLKRVTRRGLIVAAIAATIALPPWLQSAAASGQRIVIDIQKFKFAPKTLTVKPGDIIVWVNKDIVAHTATAKDGSWDSGLIKPGGQWEMVVKGNAVQAYICRFHPSMKAGLDTVS